MGNVGDVTVNLKIKKDPSVDAAKTIVEDMRARMAAVRASFQENASAAKAQGRAAAQALRAQAKAARDAEKAVGKSFGNMAKGVKGFISTLQSALGIYVGFSAVRGVMSWAEEKAHEATETLSRSKQIGVSTKTLQEWSYVAQRSGSNAKEFAVAIGQTERALRSYAAGKGSKMAAESFKAFGISSNFAAKELRKPGGLNDILFRISERAQKAGNTGLTAARMMGFAGRYARGFAADMEQGPKALREQIQHVHEIGGVLSDDQLNSLKEMNTSILDAKTSLNALLTQALAAIAPEIIKIANAASKWIAANKELITEKVKEGFRIIISLVKEIGRVIAWLVDHVELVKAAFGGLIGGKIAYGLWNIVGPLLKIGSALNGISGAAPGAASALGGVIGAAGKIGIGGVLARAAIPAAVGFGIGKLIKGDETEAETRWKLSPQALMARMRGVSEQEFNARRDGGAGGLTLGAISQFQGLLGWAGRGGKDSASGTPDITVNVGGIKIDGSSSPADVAKEIASVFANVLRSAMVNTRGNPR